MNYLPPFFAIIRRLSEEIVPINPLDLANARKRREWIRKKNAKVINFKDTKGNYALDVLLIYDYKSIEWLKAEI
ncbi:MAG: hypothetical protein ACPL28_08875 [bacterium]